MEKNLFINKYNDDREMIIENNNPIDENDPFWDNPMDTFESAMSSIVSSPVANYSGGGGGGEGDNFVIRQVIGRLGSLCNSDDEISAQSYYGGYNNSTNTSCYSTPLNSPPKQTTRGNLLFSGGSSSLGVSQGFAPERAATTRYSSCFAMANGDQFGVGLKLNDTTIDHLSHGFVPKVDSETNNFSSNHSINISASQFHGSQILDSGQNSSITAATGGSEIVQKETTNPKKRKTTTTLPKGRGDVNQTEAEEAPKDYIHVRARRGQATDAHSLAERVRREKISDKMKVLQDLVPGCNKVTGKAVMLDEIINYVQSLQRQVEFMSMKLSTIDAAGMNYNDEAHHQPKGELQLGGPMHWIQSHDPYQSQNGTDRPSTMPNEIEQNPYSVGRNPIIQCPPVESFNAPSPSQPQVEFWHEDDLQNVLLQLGNDQNQPQNTSYI